MSTRVMFSGAAKNLTCASCRSERQEKRVLALAQAIERARAGT